MCSKLHEPGRERTLELCVLQRAAVPEGDGRVLPSTSQGDANGEDEGEHSPPAASLDAASSGVQLLSRATCSVNTPALLALPGAERPTSL